MTTLYHLDAESGNVSGRAWPNINYSSLSQVIQYIQYKHQLLIFITGSSHTTQTMIFQNLALVKNLYSFKMKIFLGLNTP